MNGEMSDNLCHALETAGVACHAFTQLVIDPPACLLPSLPPAAMPSGNAITTIVITLRSWLILSGVKVVNTGRGSLITANPASH